VGDLEQLRAMLDAQREGNIISGLAMLVVAGGWAYKTFVIPWWRARRQEEREDDRGESRRSSDEHLVQILQQLARQDVQLERLCQDKHGLANTASLVASHTERLERAADAEERALKRIEDAALRIEAAATRLEKTGG
jgi:hypothetical protein